MAAGGSWKKSAFLVVITIIVLHSGENYKLSGAWYLGLSSPPVMTYNPEWKNDFSTQYNAFAGGIGDAGSCTFSLIYCYDDAPTILRGRINVTCKISMGLVSGGISAFDFVVTGSQTTVRYYKQTDSMGNVTIMSSTELLAGPNGQAAGIAESVFSGYLRYLGQLNAEAIAAHQNQRYYPWSNFDPYMIDLHVPIVPFDPNITPPPGGGTGPAGPAGAPGPTGPEGPAGPAGPQGDPGPEGPTGPTGPQGVPGPEGPAGPSGPAGADGAPGTPGSDGAPGAPGVPGRDGADGASGAPGVPGAPGTPGTDGTNGKDGADGAQGPQGPQGARGATGDTGAKGDTGAQGAQGAPGERGAQGPQGEPGAVTNMDALIDVITDKTGQTDGAGLPSGDANAAQAGDFATQHGNRVRNALNGLLTGSDSVSYDFRIPFPGMGERVFSIQSRPPPGSALDGLRLLVRALLTVCVCIGAYVTIVKTLKYY